MGSTGLVPSIPVYRALQNFPNGTKNLKYQAALLGVLATARAEMEKITAVTHVKTSLRTNFPPTILPDPHVGQRVRVYR